MTYINCKKCKRPFAMDSSLYCESCIREENETFEKVRDYLYDNPNCNINQVSADTKVPVGKIFDYIRSGRIGLNSM